MSSELILNLLSVVAATLSAVCASGVINIIYKKRKKEYELSPEEQLQQRMIKYQKELLEMKIEVETLKAEYKKDEEEFLELITEFNNLIEQFEMINKDSHQ
jgi:sugar-specific transcriptional regulator TrmB